MRSKWYFQLIVVIFGLWMLVVFTRQFLVFFNSGDRISEAEEEVKKLEQENARLKAEREYRQTNFFVEKEAREKLGYGINGESVIVFKQETATPEAKLEQGEDIPNWKKWWNFLFN